MTIKKLYAATIILAALGFAIIGIMICFMPDTVPIHYNARGEVDGMGSRYTYLIFPAFSALSTLVIMLLSRLCSNDSEKKVMQYTVIFMVLLFDLLGIFFAYLAANFEYGSFSDSNGIVYKITFITLGLLLVILGNLMPKFRKNYFIGLRTIWSLSSDSVWQKSNRFAGISAVVCGFVMIVCSALLSGITVLIIGIVLMIIWTAISAAASYTYYQNNFK